MILLRYCLGLVFMTLTFQFLGQSASRQSNLYACPFYKHEELANAGSPGECAYTGRGFRNMAEVT